MIFTKTSLQGVFIIDIEKIEDVRGFFARTWCEKEFGEHGLATHFLQASISYSKKKGTLRGLHYQASPCQEAKLVRCIRGQTFSAVVDLRPDSLTFMQHFSAIMEAQDYQALYVPPGLAHGFQTLTDHTEVFYHMSESYQPAYARGVRWDDPAFAIRWPEDERTILDRDNSYPDFEAEAVE
ncbi:MAG: dTDP-4-dehydrorhamnose 3,5-epimerase [Gammaproteobacteria bacterium]|nr:MAG: dTDP-4-dehydrorhamnose 3,5-epimerase [Gammaproteobacteria bacterium]